MNGPTLSAAVCGLSLLFSLTQCSFDRKPSRLSDKTETIEVIYVNWACDCPDWVETRFSRDSAGPDQRNCIYIEPSSPDLAVPDSFYSTKHFSQTLRLSGRFYLDKGIPDGYEPKTVGKTEPGKVFRYDNIEFIDR